MKTAKTEYTDMPAAKPASPIYRDCIKRILDLLIIIPVFIVAFIPMLLIAAAVKIDSKGPVFFKAPITQCGLS